MSRFLTFLFAIFIVTLASAPVFAVETIAPAKPVAKTIGPCRQIMAGCKTAGYGKGGDKYQHGLRADCYLPIVKDGKTVGGVSIAPATIKQCQDNRAKNAAKTAKRATAKPPVKVN